MTRLAELQDRVASLTELEQIVAALRSLASMRVQEAVKALDGIRQYAATIATAIADALQLTPEGSATTRAPARSVRLVIVFLSESGFVGGLNERLLDAACEDLGASDVLCPLGSRGAALAEERGLRIGWRLPLPTRLASVPDTVRHILAELYRAISAGEVREARMIFARYRRSAAPTIERRTLFPIDLKRPVGTRAQLPPLHNLAPAELLEKLIAEYVFARLTRAATDSLASENAARFAAMEAAHDNVAKRLEELQQQARQARQEEITAELLDIVTGAASITRQ